MGSRDVDLVIVEPSDRLWRGSAYRMDRDEIVVNAPAAMMTLGPDDPGHAQRWLAREDGGGARHSWTQEVFPPRHAYGRYLEECLSQTLDGLTAADWRVTCVRRRALSATSDGDKAVVGLDGGGSIRCDHAVLCVGNPSGYDPCELAGHPYYIPRPYPVASALGSVHPSASLALIGCGFTAVDAVLGLRAQRHQGLITLLSRDGILAAVRRPQQAGQPAVLNPHAVRKRLESPSPPLRRREVAATARKEALRAGAAAGQIAAELSLADWGAGRLRRRTSHSLSR
ncbi:FAD/NAD(P)-binding protein [Streptomyces sp. MT29]|nr:FAD/NAD(P)-binding protein [Streptomyces sp. MT29]